MKTKSNIIMDKGSRGILLPQVVATANIRLKI